MSDRPHQSDESSGKLELKLNSTDRSGQLISLKKKKITVGSDESCSIVLQSPSVQPVHCMIIQGTSGTIIRNFHADTRLNGEAVGEAWIQTGDTISVADIDMKLVSVGSEEADSSKGSGGTEQSDSPADPEARSNQILDLIERLENLELELAEVKSSNRQLGQEAGIFKKQVGEKLVEIDQLEKQNSELLANLEFKHQDKAMIQTLENQAVEFTKKNANLESALQQKEELIQQFAAQNSKLAQEISLLRQQEKPDGALGESGSPDQDSNVDLTQRYGDDREPTSVESGDLFSHYLSDTEAVTGTGFTQVNDPIATQNQNDTSPETSIDFDPSGTAEFGERSEETSFVSDRMDLGTGSPDLHDLSDEPSHSLDTSHPLPPSGEDENISEVHDDGHDQQAADFLINRSEPDTPEHLEQCSETEGSSDESTEIDSPKESEPEEPHDPFLTLKMIDQARSADFFPTTDIPATDIPADHDDMVTPLGDAGDDESAEDPKSFSVDSIACEESDSDFNVSEKVSEETRDESGFGNSSFASGGSLEHFHEAEIEEFDDATGQLAARFDIPADDYAGSSPDSPEEVEDDLIEEMEFNFELAEANLSYAIDELEGKTPEPLEIDLTGLEDEIELISPGDETGYSDSQTESDVDLPEFSDAQAQSFFEAISRSEQDNPYTIQLDGESDEGSGDNHGIPNGLLTSFGKTVRELIDEIQAQTEAQQEVDSIEPIDDSKYFSSSEEKSDVEDQDYDGQNSNFPSMPATDTPESQGQDNEDSNDVQSMSIPIGEDSYIQEYMKKLMGGEEAEFVAEEPPKEEAPQETPSLLEKTFQNEIRERNELLKPGDFRPKSAAPEKGSNLEAMRELANQTARSAIEASSRKKRMEQLSMTALIAAGFCFFIAASLAMVSTSMLSVSAIFSIVFFSLTGLGAWFYFDLKNISDNTADQSEEADDPTEQPKMVAATREVENTNPAMVANLDPAEGPNEVQGGEEADRS